MYLILELSVFKNQHIKRSVETSNHFDSKMIRNSQEENNISNVNVV
jgi:hypothetical protein